jgi:heme-degrading monooxygenase HmoA
VTQIIQGADVTTLINTFTTTPETQGRVLDILLESTEKHIRHLPGFINANFHKAPDGTRIVNYSQWASPDAWKAMQADPVAGGHIAELLSLVTADWNLYEVVATFTPAEAAVSPAA